MTVVTNALLETLRTRNKKGRGPAYTFIERRLMFAGFQKFELMEHSDKTVDAFECVARSCARDDSLTLRTPGGYSDEFRRCFNAIHGERYKSDSDKQSIERLEHMHRLGYEIKAPLSLITFRVRTGKAMADGRNVRKTRGEIYNDNFILDFELRSITSAESETILRDKWPETSKWFKDNIKIGNCIGCQRIADGFNLFHNRPATGKPLSTSAVGRYLNYPAYNIPPSNDHITFEFLEYAEWEMLRKRNAA